MLQLPEMQFCMGFTLLLYTEKLLLFGPLQYSVLEENRLIAFFKFLHAVDLNLWW